MMPWMTTFWVSEVTVSCQEAKVLEALQYDIESPCIVQWAMLRYSAPTRLNNSYLNHSVIGEKYYEAVKMAIQSAFILPCWRMNTPRSCFLRSMSAVWSGSPRGPCTWTVILGFGTGWRTWPCGWQRRQRQWRRWRMRHKEFLFKRTMPSGNDGIDFAHRTLRHTHIFSVLSVFEAFLICEHSSLVHGCGSSHDSRETDDSLMRACSKITSSARHVSQTTPRHPRLFFLLFDTTYLDTCSIDADWRRIVWLLLTQVVSPSSASTSAVSTRLSIIPSERTASTLRMTWRPQSPTFFLYDQQPAAASIQWQTWLSPDVWSGVRQLVRGKDSVAGVDESVLREKRDRDLDSVRTLSGRQNLHNYLERKAESAVRKENTGQKLKPIWKLEVGNRKVHKPFMKPNLKVWSCIRRINGQTRLKEKDQFMWRIGNGKCKYSQLHMRYIQSLTHPTTSRETRAHRTQDVTTPSTPTTTPRRVGSLPQGHPGLWSTPVGPGRTPTVHRCLCGGRPWVARRNLHEDDQRQQTTGHRQASRQTSLQ